MRRSNSPIVLYHATSYLGDVIEIFVQPDGFSRTTHHYSLRFGACWATDHCVLEVLARYQFKGTHVRSRGSVWWLRTDLQWCLESRRGRMIREEVRFQYVRSGMTRFW